MGGHGGLNILPQKSWNVYSCKNRECVAQDEARAAQEEQDAAFAAASDKAGLNLMVMRARAGGMHEHVAPDGGSDISMGPPPTTIGAHVNLFADVEAADRVAEKEAARKREDARAVARLMPDLDLSKSAREPAPWYMQAPPPPLSSQISPATVELPTAAPSTVQALPGVLSVAGASSATVVSVGAVDIDVNGHPCASRKRKHRHKERHRDRRRDKEEDRRRDGDKSRKHGRHSNQQPSSSSSSQERERTSKRGGDGGVEREAALHRLRKERLERERHEQRRATAPAAPNAGGGAGTAWSREPPDHNVRQLRDHFMQLTGQVVTLGVRPPRRR